MSENDIERTSSAPRVVAMISGGLDSVLAIKLMQLQKIEVVALHLLNPFDDQDSIEDSQVMRSAEMLGVELNIQKKNGNFIDIIRYPAHGFGAALNPCIDCRIHSLKAGARLMKRIGAIAVVTGEVLGQRPMSQQRHQMNLIERRSGLEGRLLRPLSALLLEPTIPELKGLIDREMLMDISGRGRKRQLELSRQYKLTNIPSGGGGCLLTDKIYCAKLQDLYDHRDILSVADFLSIKFGRHFRFDSECKAIVGRDEKENIALATLVRPAVFLLEPINFVGPSILVEGEDNPRNRRRVLGLMRRYSKGKMIVADENPAALIRKHDEKDETIEFLFDQDPEPNVEKWRIG